MDGLVSKKGGRFEVVVVGPSLEKIEHVEHLAFPVTNNETEYEALLASLKIAEVLGDEGRFLLEDERAQQ